MRCITLLIRFAVVWLILFSIQNPEYLIAAIAFLLLMAVSFLRWLRKHL